MEVMPLDSDIAVRQANKLIESIYKMDVNEHKLLVLATKKVNEMELRKEPFNERTKITITSAEFARQYGIERSSAFKILIEAKKSIYDRDFVYLHQEKDGTVSPMKSRWFQARGVDKSKSEISFMFASAVIPLIYLVKSEYTLLDLREMGKLKSKYAVRLYKYLMRWVNAPYKNKIPIEKMREIFGLDDDEYPEMCDFRKRVLDIAVKQIKAGTGFKDLTVKNYKTGVKVTAFSFHYTSYENELIKNTRKQIIENEAGQKAEYVIYRMTDDQIRKFSKALATKATNIKDNPALAGLGDLIGPGQGWEALADKIAIDWGNRVFEPYLGYLEAIGFKPTVFNKTPFNGQSGENTPPDEGNPDQESEKPAENPGEEPKNPENAPFQLPDNVFNKYKAKGGKLTKDQILEAAMAENVQPFKIMLNEGIRIFG